MKLTFLGSGSMAQALVEGLASKYDIEVVGRNSSSLLSIQKSLPKVSTKLIEKGEDISNKNIVLCIKPHSIKDLSSQLTGRANIVLSVLAGTSLDSLKTYIDSKKYVRTMPNIGASFLASMTTLTGDETVKDISLDIFNKIGRTLWLNSEKELNIATGVAGSGPAFLALIAEALGDGAVEAGIKREDANILVKGLFNSFTSLIDHQTPSSIKDKVMSPGGTTAAGYVALEKYGVRSSMIEAIKEAYKRANELNRSS
jgi:pyrroline-5-carboxylate reductase